MKITTLPGLTALNSIFTEGLKENSEGNFASLLGEILAILTEVKNPLPGRPKEDAVEERAPLLQGQPWVSPGLDALPPLGEEDLLCGQKKMIENIPCQTEDRPDELLDEPLNTPGEFLNTLFALCGINIEVNAETSEPQAAIVTEGKDPVIFTEGKKEGFLTEDVPIILKNLKNISKNIPKEILDFSSKETLDFRGLEGKKKGDNSTPFYDSPSRKSLFEIKDPKIFQQGEHNAKGLIQENKSESGYNTWEGKRAVPAEISSNSLALNPKGGYLLGKGEGEAKIWNSVEPPKGIYSFSHSTPENNRIATPEMKARESGRSFVFNQIVEKLDPVPSHIIERGGEIRVQLHPRNLGEVVIRVRREGERLAAEVKTESVLVKELVESRVGELRQRFTQLNLPVDRFNVTVGDGSGAGGEGAHQRSGDNFNKRGPQLDRQTGLTGSEDNPTSDYVVAGMINYLV